MMRRLLNLLTGLSLVLCVAVCVLWVRSYWGSDWVEVQRSGLKGPRQYQIATEVYTDEGNFVLTRDSRRAQLGPDAPDGGLAQYFVLSSKPDGVRWRRFPPRTMDHGLQVFGFAARHGFVLEVRGSGDGPYTGDWYTVASLPLYSATGLLALLPTVRLFKWFQKPRRQPGLCPACGYDLRATPDKCPECGHVSAAGVAPH